MRVFQALLTGAAVVLTTTAIGTTTQAQSFRNVGGPKEVPPASYSSRYYVDSRGCSYIKAGYGGTVTWVPQVTRGRKAVCGLKPSNVAGAGAPPRSQQQPRQFQAATSNPGAQAAPTAALSSPPPAANTRVAASPKTAPRRRNGGFWNWWLTPQARRTVVTTSAPLKVQPAPVLTAVVPQVVAPPRRRVNQLAVRNGPQAIHPSFYATNRGSVNTGIAQAAQPQIARNIYSARAVGTVAGKAAMDLIWTETVPRRLIDATTGRDVTAIVPVTYPYVAVSTSNRRFAEAGATHVHKPSSPRLLRTPVIIEEDDAAPGVVLKSSKSFTGIEFLAAELPQSSPVDLGPDLMLAKSYVQVATFGVPANASRTLAQFEARGLPTTARPFARKGKQYQIVLLGPFRRADALKAAKITARQAGFADAFVVK